MVSLRRSLTRGKGLPFPATEQQRLPGPSANELAIASLALARRLAAGATLWCWSPPWPHHAQHVAVEFVHPVIVGKRAFPAEAVDGADAVAILRSLVAPGDVVLAIAPASDVAVASVMRRAAAWGVTTLWMGVGPRPPDGAADGVLWAGGDDIDGAYCGDVVVLYHLLWELTHVCFEHPGLLREAVPCDGPVCITCADEARVGEVVAVAVADMATVRTAGGPEEVMTTLVGPVAAGDLVLIHAGTAIGRVEGP